MWCVLNDNDDYNNNDDDDYYYNNVITSAFILVGLIIKVKPFSHFSLINT